LLGALEARAKELTDAATEAIYHQISSRMFEPHVYLFALLATFEKLRLSHQLTNNELALFVNGVDTSAVENNAVCENKPEWMSKKVSISLSLCFSLSLFLSLSLSVCFLSLSLYLSLYISSAFSVLFCLSFSLSVCLSLMDVTSTKCLPDVLYLTPEPSHRALLPIFSMNLVID